MAEQQQTIEVQDQEAYTDGLEFEPSQEINPQSAAAMAEELAAADEAQDLDFDPMAAISGMTEEQQEAASCQLKAVLTSDDGSKAAAVDGLDMAEHLIQEHCHKDFVISDKSKKMGASTLGPLIQQYAPAAIDVLGGYKVLIAAGIYTGSLIISSRKQLIELKKRDALADESNTDNAEPEQQLDDTEEPNEVVAEADAAN